MPTFKAYISGFVISVLLTLGAYFMVLGHVQHRYVISLNFLVFALLVLAMLQLFVQMVLFLHLSTEKKARGNLIAFISAFSLILIVVIGSIWIMNHLNYNMSPQDMNAYILKSENFFR